LFLQVLLIFFSACNLLFWSGTIRILFSVRTDLMWHGSSWLVQLPQSFVSATTHLGCFVYLDVLNEPASKPKSSAFLHFKAFEGKNSALF
jgi:hypothetical protein